MSSSARNMLQRAAPWRPGISWGMVLAEAIIALGIGIYVLIQPETAAAILRVLISVVLLISSALRIYAGFRSSAQSNPLTPYLLLSGGVGIVVGLVVVFAPLPMLISTTAAMLILAFGLVLYGLVGLAGAVITRAGTNFAITSTVSLVFGVLLYFSVQTGAIGIEWFGVVAIVAGLVLAALAFLLRQQQSRPPMTTAAGAP